MITEKLILEAWKFLRDKNSSVPDETIDFMRDAALEKLEQVKEEYNPEFGDNKLCICGHPYYRHFDPYEDMYPVGCKYCNCHKFEQQGIQKITKKVINIQDYLNVKNQEIVNRKEQEEKDFIKMLRYFVKIQEPRIDTVIINLLDGFKFELLENGNKINLSQLGYISEIEDIDPNDLLFSALVTLNPTKIILKQNSKNRLDLTHLTQIFSNVEIINQ